MIDGSMMMEQMFITLRVIKMTMDELWRKGV